MKHLIKVTAKHIRKGKRLNCYRCPIALAIKEQLSLTNMEVHFTGVFTGTWANSIKYKISRSAARFIKRFDAGKSVKPFNFMLTR